MAKNLPRTTRGSYLVNNFHYLNVNPKNKKEPDCVTRAICLALQIPYSMVSRMLTDNGDIYTCDDLRVMCYSKLLSNEFGLKSCNGRGRTVGEIADIYKCNKLLLRIDGHLTCAIDGIVYDIWDCTNEICDIYWVI